jgi:O-antigen/teichoic acid export membrane protein
MAGRRTRRRRELDIPIQADPTTAVSETLDRLDAEPGNVSVGPLGRVVLRGAAFSSVGFLLEQTLTIAAAIVLAHLVTPTEFGIYGSATILLGYAAMVADSGLQSAVIQRGDRVLEAASTAFAANVVTGIGLALLAGATAPLLGLFFHERTIGWVAAAMAGTVALNCLMLVPDALLQRSFSFFRRLFVSPSSALTYGIVAGILCGLGFGVWGLVIGRYAGIVVELVIIWTLVDWRPRLSAISFAMWRSLAQYGRHIFAASALTQSRTSVVTALLGRFVGIDAVGQMRYATTMVTLPRATWVVSSSYVVFPAFARIAEDAERFKSAFLRTVRWGGITTLPASAILLPLGPAIVVTLLGDQWREAGYAVMALVGVPIAGALSSVVSEGVKGMGRPQVLSRTALVSSIATIVLAIAFVPLGVVGVAGAMSLAAMVTAAYLIRLALPVLALDRASILRALWPSFAATTAMVAVLFPLEWLVVEADTHRPAVAIPLLVGEVAIGFAVYVFVLGILDRDAVRTLRGAWHALAGSLRRRRNARTQVYE